MKRLLTALVLAGLVASGCSIGPSSGRTYQAEFSRAIQVFPGIKVRVLGVDVGTVTDIKNSPGGVTLTLRLVDDSVKLPADVKAAIVPMSLLGERYIQLFPAYEGGPTLATGATIPTSRTAVPAEPDELLRSLQDYLGALDPKTVTSFVENAAEVLQGNGNDLNELLKNAASVEQTLASKREDLSGLIVELNKLTVALGTRQEALGRLIRSYDTVAGVINDNRSALEGTVSGLNEAASQLASLLVEHQIPLGQDIQSLTRTGRTLDRNVGALAETSHWSRLLFEAASRAVDFDHDWLRLNNQGAPLAALILLRLEQRLIDLCTSLGSPSCSTPTFWAAHVPALFCFTATCPKVPQGTAAKQLTAALNSQPKVKSSVQKESKTQGGDGTTSGVVQQLLGRTLGDPGAFGGPS